MRVRDSYEYKKKICIFIGLILVLLFVTVIFKYDKGEKSAVVLKNNNLREYEEIFGQSLQEYLDEEDNNFLVKDITKSKLNDVYREEELIAKNYYTRAGLISLNKEEDLAFGMSYKIPTICLNADSNLLFAKENGDYWIVEDNAVCITFNFNVLKSTDEAEEIENVLEVGLWQNRGSVTTSKFIDKKEYYEIKIWAFKGDKIYPRIRNMSDTPYIIADGKISLTKDDTMKKAQ